MNIVVIGGGLAGAKAVEELRSEGFDGDLTLIGAEPHAPYERPPLSKDLLLGKAEPESAFVHRIEWYEDKRVDLLTGTEVTGIDARERWVDIPGKRIPFDRLLIATGAHPRHLTEVDESGAGPVYLRTLEDSRRLKDALRGHLLIVGAGWIGLEVASAARAAGAEVTIVEPATLPLATVLGDRIAPMFADLHRQHGVDLHLGATLTGITDEGGRTRARLSDGFDFFPDLVVVGIGAIPNDELARGAGLDTDHGILVDANLRTSSPDIWAAGDVANHDHPTIGQRVRVEHWDSAIQQGKHAARAMLGDTSPYTRQPYFFTDQYDLGMEYVGYVDRDGADEVVVRGTLDGDRVMSALWIKDGRVAAGMHANDWDAITPIRALVGTEADDRVRNPDLPLAELVADQPAS